MHPKASKTQPPSRPVQRQPRICLTSQRPTARDYRQMAAEQEYLCFVHWGVAIEHVTADAPHWQERTRWYAYLLQHLSAVQS